MLRRSTFLSSLVALSVLVLMSAFTQAAGNYFAPSTEKAIVQVDDRERVVATGDVVARGRRIVLQDRNVIQGSEGQSFVCDIPETKVGLKGSGAGTSLLRVEVTDNCQLVIAAISGDVPVPERYAARTRNNQGQGRNRRDILRQAATVTRQTGGWTEHKDRPGLVLSEAYAHIKYRDDGSRVSGAYGQVTYCSNARDGWFGTNSLWDWSNTNRSVWIWKRCSFSWVGGSYKHTLDVDVYSWPGNDWAVYCTWRGDIVPGGWIDCGRAHKRL